MKNINTISFRMLAIAFLISTSLTILAQQPPSPPGESSNNSGNKLNGGGAPIGGGLFILLGLGAAYGSRKLYMMKKDSLEE